MGGQSWSRQASMGQGKAVFITGCDSGIGLSVAENLAREGGGGGKEGLRVVAGVLNPDSGGAARLSALQGVELLQLDVTDHQSVQRCFRNVEIILNRSNLELIGVINNAGVMIFGEFEWQTEDQISRQISVNLLGSMRVAKVFAPLLRKYKARLINVSSHCADTPLPCLSVYSASKAALQAWSSALILEMNKYSVPVITIQPGGYARESCILEKQKEAGEEMRAAMSSELQTLSKESFDLVMSYMSAVSSPTVITDPALLRTFRRALFDPTPRGSYVNSPWRYTLYYGLISLARPFPSLRRRLILAFISLPKYK